MRQGRGREKLRLTVKLDVEWDADLIAWFETFPRGQRSAVVRDALREAMRPRGVADLAAIREALADGASLPYTARIEHDAPQAEDVMYFSAQVAEVDVDTETGEVKLRRVVTAHDVGTVINPLGHQGQINGGFVTGLGLAISRRIVEAPHARGTAVYDTPGAAAYVATVAVDTPARAATSSIVATVSAVRSTGGVRGMDPALEQLPGIGRGERRAREQSTGQDDGAQCSTHPLRFTSALPAFRAIHAGGNHLPAYRAPAGLAPDPENRVDRPKTRVPSRK